MTYCINIKSVILEKIIKQEYPDKNYKPNIHINFYYKYDFNILSEFKILTNAITVTNYKNRNVSYLNVKSPELDSLYNKINKMFKFNNNLNKKKHIKLTHLDLESESESESDSDEENIDMAAYNDAASYNGRIYYKNDTSQLKLHPTKKSGLEEYTITKTENFDKIDTYYRHLYKYNIEGNFILKLYVYNCKTTSKYYMKFIIISGDLKHPMSFVKKDNTIKNVYDTSKIKIDI